MCQCFLVVLKCVSICSCCPLCVSFLSSIMYESQLMPLFLQSLIINTDSSDTIPPSFTLPHYYAEMLCFPCRLPRPPPRPHPSLPSPAGGAAADEDLSGCCVWYHHRLWQHCCQGNRGETDLSRDARYISQLAISPEARLSRTFFSWLKLFCYFKCVIIDSPHVCIHFAPPSITCE